ncbi:hypothetical protein [Pseudonocardia sp. TMWB2A]|uniref:hypothetical protein n=1 Tax=Pseudonocardia sp. TMWB2A TaxID=687430 RepID=UPI00307EC389
MTEWFEFHPTAIVALAGLAVAVIGTIAERRRANRRNINNVGFMPWRGIVLAGIFVALIAGAYAFKGG